jgi:succinyl-diaminopimelate desuccinylase
LFACHLDVVGPGDAAWKHPPFAAVESDGRIYGRGSVDMKGPTAAVVTAIGRIVDSGARLQGDLIFLACAGEETDSCGAIRFAADHGELPVLAGVIVPEPTDFAVATAHRGMLWLEVTTKGRAAHSSAPQLGVNAINSMRLILNELEGYKFPAEPHELLGECSMSINTITGGKAPNVVPDKCSTRIDIRTLPGQSNQGIVADFERIFAGLKSRDRQFDAEVSVLREMHPLETDCGCDFVRDFCSCVGAVETKVVNFATDAPHFVPLGAPAVIFGPGKPALCHKPDEHIDVADLEKAAEYYRQVILSFLT